ncbi:MAG: zinc ABC transporter permease [Micrococcales bacterium]|nr:zinc ABC transporter permease [Micrococcales bacterium]
MIELPTVTVQENWLEILTADFMRQAFIGGIITAVAAGAIGYFVILRQQAFASHALAHIGFPGATAAILLGIPITLGMVTFTVVGAIAMALTGNRLNDRDIATGTILAFATGLGLLFSNIASTAAANVQNVLFGNLLATTTSQLISFAVFLFLICLTIAICYRPLLFTSISPEVARARGLHTGRLNLIFLVTLALTITMAVQVVGVLLVFALIVTPPATALLLTARSLPALFLSIGIGTFAVIGGLVLSALFNLPPTFFIVSITTLLWVIATITRPQNA